MSDFIILALIVILILCLLVTLAAFVLYSGLFSDVDIKTGSPPITNVTIAYKFRQGNYKDCGALYTEACSIGPALCNIGLFYDDPQQTPAERCRSAVGSVLSEGEGRPDPELQKLYEKFGFKVFSLPGVSHAVTTSFPCTTPLSHLLGPYRVYPQLACYVQERKLSAFPAIEVCKSELIHYMMPLSRQTDFFVPEMRDEVKRETKDPESDEDRGSDITGADSNSEASWVSGAEPGESRESSLAPSSSLSPALASSLLPPPPPSRDRDQGDGEEPCPPHREHSDRGSVGSGSSFEELDLEQEVVEGEEEEEEEQEGPVGEEEEKPTMKEGAPGDAPPPPGAPGPAPPPPGAPGPAPPPPGAPGTAAEDREPVGDGEE